MLLAAALGFILVLILVIRVLAIACAVIAGSATWDATRDPAAASMGALGVLFAARLLLDLAALQDGARPVTVAAEILAAGGAAAAIAGAALGQGAGPGQGLSTSLISLGAASAAMAGVARLRVLP